MDLDEVQKDFETLNILSKDIKQRDNVELFYQCLFFLYAKEGYELATANSTKFLVVMEGVYKKGNSVDPNIITVKKLTDEWLNATSEVYRVANRQATLNNFRKAIFTYFVYSVGLSRTN